MAVIVEQGVRIVTRKEGVPLSCVTATEGSAGPYYGVSGAVGFRVALLQCQ
jgi:hypothetical protein